MKYSHMAFLVLALTGSISQAVTLVTMEGQTVNVAPQAIIEHVDAAAKEMGQIIFVSQQLLPNGHAIIDNPRYMFNGTEYFIRSDDSAGTCKLLGFNGWRYWNSNYAKEELVTQTSLAAGANDFRGTPIIQLFANGSIGGVWPNSNGFKILARADCYHVTK